MKGVLLRTTIAYISFVYVGEIMNYEGIQLITTIVSCALQISETPYMFSIGLSQSILTSCSKKRKMEKITLRYPK